MTITEQWTTEYIDDFLLGNLDATQNASFESRMQSDVDLAIAVSERVAFLDSIERAAHATRPDVELAVATSSESRNSSLKAFLWIAGVAAALCLTVGLLPDSGEDQASQATAKNALSPDTIGQVADHWLVLLEEDASEEVGYLEEIDLLPISIDDSWIGELALQAYQDNEA